MSKVFVFHGGDHKCGVSQISQSAAEMLAKRNPDMTVMLIHADGGRGSEYCSNVRESVGRIRPYLAEQILDTKETLDRARYRDNLYIIGGSDDPLSASALKSDMSEFLISALKNFCDVFIIDAGSGLNPDFCLGALFSADRVYLMLVQSENCLRNFEWNRGLYEQLRIPFDVFIINKYDRLSAYDTAYIGKRLGIENKKLIKLPAHSMGELCEAKGQSLMSVRKERAFEKGLELIVKDIEENAEHES